MNRTLTSFFLLALTVAASLPAYSRTSADLNIQFHADIASTCPQMMMTMAHDALGRPYLYVAGKEGGLRIFDISNIDSPVPVATIPITSLENLHVMNLAQSGNYVYLALGNHFSNSQSPGMAIVDVTNPASAFVADTWKSTDPDGGAGIVAVEGDYAYLGAMKNGLVILDVSDPSDITFMSKFVPDIDYPTPDPNPDLYNARGMAVRDDIVYLCYDAGGLRIINTVDKLGPIETGHYSNPALNGLPRAYNNIVLDGSLAYIAVDYCGLEVLNVSDTSSITLVGWWNPYNCPTNNWFTSPVHANELAYNRECKLLFVSTGKSDMYVLDMENPSAPDSSGFYGGVSNDIGTWGVSTYQNEIFLSYVCAVIPFASNWTGVKILTYDNSCTSDVPENPANAVGVFPSANGDRITILSDGTSDASGPRSVSVTNLLGQTFFPTITESLPFRTSVDTSILPDGIYLLYYRVGHISYKKKFIRVGR